MIGLTAHNWQKMKKSIFLTCPHHKICRVEEAVGLKVRIILQNYDFCEYVKFGAISWKKFVNNCLIKVRI